MGEVVEFQGRTRLAFPESATPTELASIGSCQYRVGRVDRGGAYVNETFLIVERGPAVHLYQKGKGEKGHLFFWGIASVSASGQHPKTEYLIEKLVCGKWEDHW